MTSILEVPMQENDAEAATIGDYFRALLSTLWTEGESFSGKRPFGNSGWDYDIYTALVKEKVVNGKIDQEGSLIQCDEDAANGLIMEAIRTFGKTA
jgi:hypothetical protein